jgi:hypothetical protein
VTNSPRTTEMTPSAKTNPREPLQRALAMGKSGFKLQLRNLFVLTQPNQARALPTEVVQTLTPTQARYEVLARICNDLSPISRQRLLNDLQNISDVSIRAGLLARTVSSFGTKTAQPYVTQIWLNSGQIVHPVWRAEAMFDIAKHFPKEVDLIVNPSPLGQIVKLAYNIKNVEARLRALIGIAPHLPNEQRLIITRNVLSELVNQRNDVLSTKTLTTLAPYLPSELTELTLSVARMIKSQNERARALTALAPYIINQFQEEVRREALLSIDKIENEEERADQLIAFAPYLESASKEAFPRLLEQALTTTILMVRRALRARLLVALAPHLTPDLQGEAIAAVHNMTSERERATLLAQLAPTLPSNMLVASLAVAYTMREQDSRVHALSTLAHYVPDYAKQQTTLDALASATNLPNYLERVNTLVMLLDILPDPLRQQALTNALETARLIENESARARALNILGAHLPESLLLRAFGIAQELESAEHRLNALLGLAPYIPKKKSIEIVQDMLSCVVSMG